MLIPATDPGKTPVSFLKDVAIYLSRSLFSRKVLRFDRHQNPSYIQERYGLDTDKIDRGLLSLLLREMNHFEVILFLAFGRRFDVIDEYLHNRATNNKAHFYFL